MVSKGNLDAAEKTALDLVQQHQNIIKNAFASTPGQDHFLHLCM